MSYVLHRSCNSNLPTVQQGQGLFLKDTNGKQYLDACGGAAVSCLGYDNQRVISAIKQQIDQVAYVHTSFFTNNPQEQLAQHLIKHHHSNDFKFIYFVSGGSEAVEAAFKLARQYYFEQGQHQKKYILARKQSYHGNTLGALSAGGNLWRRKMFDPILLSPNHISACYQWRDQQQHESAYQYGQRIANELETEILRLGAENTLAFIAEPVVGATAGALVPVEGYFKRIREICDQYDILLILDEVMCGMGRTGTLHACEQDGIVGDLQTVAKGIAGGYQPLGAVFVSAKIHDTICNGSGMFQHGHTYIGHATACAAGLAVQQEIQENNLLANVKKQGQLLKKLLTEKMQDHPHIGDVRGRGLFVGIEIVQDKLNKTPFNPKLKLYSILKKKAMENGLMIYPMGGTIDGNYGDHILLAPAYTITESLVHEIVDRLILSIDQAINQV